MTANTQPAAEVRAIIEGIRARHVEHASWFIPGQRFCTFCAQGEWPCDAIKLTEMLEQALTALEAADSLADVVREIHERATINSYVRWRLRASEERYRAAARDARGGEQPGAPTPALDATDLFWHGTLRFLPLEPGDDTFRRFAEAALREPLTIRIGDIELRSHIGNLTFVQGATVDIKLRRMARD